MRGRPDEEVLRELMEEMNAMDRDKLGKKRGQSITIAIGVPKGKPEEMGEEMAEMEEEKAEGEMPMEMPMGDSPMAEESEGEMENDLMFDGEEQSLIDEAKELGIENAEEIDMRLLKKMIERKKASV